MANMVSINLPPQGIVSIEIVGGNNNAASYATAIWNPQTRKYHQIGQGLASFNDPTPDVFPLGPPAPLQGMILVVRAYVFPYQAGLSAFYVGCKVRAGTTLLATLAETPNVAATVNLIAQFA